MTSKQILTSKDIKTIVGRIKKALYSERMGRIILYYNYNVIKQLPDSSKHALKMYDFLIANLSSKNTHFIADNTNALVVSGILPESCHLDIDTLQLITSDISIF